MGAEAIHLRLSRRFIVSTRSGESRSRAVRQTRVSSMAADRRREGLASIPARRRGSDEGRREFVAVASPRRHTPHLFGAETHAPVAEDTYAEMGGLVAKALKTGVVLDA